MAVQTAQQRFEAAQTFDVETYNFDHFRFEHILWDLRQTRSGGAVQAGEIAPDFELPRVGGGTVRLSSLRGKPALLRFGSST